MSKHLNLWFGLLKIPVDFFMTFAAFITAYKIRAVAEFIPGITLPLDIHTFPALKEYYIFSLAASAGLLFFLALQKSYTLENSLRVSKELRQVAVGTSMWLMAMIAYFFLIRSFPFSRLALLYTWVFSIIFIAGGRLVIYSIYKRLFQNKKRKTNVLLIGHNRLAGQLVQPLEQDYVYHITGALDAKADRHIHNLTYVGPLEDLKTVVTKYHIEKIIQVKPELSHEQTRELLDFCREHHLKFSFVPNVLSMQQSDIDIENWDGIPLINLKPTPLDNWGRVLKRLFDLVGAIIGLIVLAPFFFIISILIKLDSKGTVFFKYLDDGSRVKRVGEKGALFHFHKFRTMHPNVHNQRYNELAKKNMRKGSPIVKIHNDPRITGFGKILRQTSLDELPQLINVLKGEMSLVGPRPHLPEEVAKYQQHHKFVLTVKPGITGLAQINGRSDLNFEEEVRLDTYYIENWSLWLDIKIILLTLPAVLRGYKE